MCTATMTELWRRFTAGCPRSPCALRRISKRVLLPWTADLHCHTINTDLKYTCSTKYIYDPESHEKQAKKRPISVGEGTHATQTLIIVKITSGSRSACQASYQHSLRRSASRRALQASHQLLDLQHLRFYNKDISCWGLFLSTEHHSRMRGQVGANIDIAASTPFKLFMIPSHCPFLRPPDCSLRSSSSMT